MPMINMTTAPIIMPRAVPAGPAFGKNVVPGITNAPHPTAHPKDSAHTDIGERYLPKPLLFSLVMSRSSVIISVPYQRLKCVV